MSNPTSNFNWQMPTATDLVTDLPADFEVFGQAVDTTLADLKGGTTGQILSKASGTDMDFTWTSPNPGDITAVNAGTGISGGGTSGDVTITNSMATAITASGDLIQGTGAGTFARLGSGTAGQVLTTNGTTLSWGNAGVTHNIQSFTSSQTWTVPSSAKYVDVLVVGGGTGGRGGKRAIENSGYGGYGGAVTVQRNIFLNGTGTVSIVIGAGSNGTAGTATTTNAADPSTAGYSGFGTYVYSQGGNLTAQYPGLAGYKGTANLYSLNNDSNQSNYAPLFSATLSNSPFINLTAQTDILAVYGQDANGFRGGYPGAAMTSTTTVNTFGSNPGMGDPGQTSNLNIRTNTLPSQDFFNLKAAPLVGAATAGSAGTGGGAGGAAGTVGVGGGGGTCTPTAGQPGGQGGAGAGGGGSWPSPVGGNGGNGGNAGTNTGAGGGAGANTGLTNAGTGGTGGNGAAGIVVVHWLS